MAASTSFPLAHVRGDILLEHEERVSIAIKKAEMFISENKETNSHLIDASLLEQLKLSRQDLDIVEKELIRRSRNN